MTNIPGGMTNVPTTSNLATFQSNPNPNSTTIVPLISSSSPETTMPNYVTTQPVTTTTMPLTTMPLTTMPNYTTQPTTTMPNYFTTQPSLTHHYTNNETDINLVVGQKKCNDGKYIYSIFHVIMSIVAIYLSVRCNKGVNYASLLIAFCFPYPYIIYSLIYNAGICAI